MYATRSQTQKLTQTQQARLKLPVQKANKVQKSDIMVREAALNIREKEMNQREADLIKRENALKKREAELTKTTEKSSKKATKQMTVMYTSNYNGEKPECSLIGHFSSEKAAVDGVIEWLFKHNKGGFDVVDLNQLFYDRSEQYPDEYDYDEADFESEEQCIEYYQKKCKNMKQLREVLANDGNSYFEDPWNGWKLRIV
jgi:hypothetical protein